jgi:hypothetical protein
LQPCRVWMIATLSQVWLQPYSSLIEKKTVTKTASDCDWKKTVAKIGKKLRLQKKTVAKTQVKKCDCKKPFQKKTPCQDTVRLRLGWYLLDVVATRWKYRWLHHPLHVVVTTDVLQLQKRQLQNQNVGDCNLVVVWLHPYSNVIAIAKKQVKRAIAINQFKKSSVSWHCQIATRLVFASCGCNLVKIRVIAK